MPGNGEVGGLGGPDAGQNDQRCRCREGQPGEPTDVIRSGKTGHTPNGQRGHVGFGGQTMSRNRPSEEVQIGARHGDHQANPPGDEYAVTKHDRGQGDDRDHLYDGEYGVFGGNQDCLAEAGQALSWRTNTAQRAHDTTRPTAIQGWADTNRN